MEEYSNETLNNSNLPHSKTVKLGKNSSISPYKQIVDKISSFNQPIYNQNNNIKQKASKMQMKFQHFLRGSSLKTKGNESKDKLNISNQKNTQLSSFSRRRNSDKNIEALINKGNEEINKIKTFKEELNETNPLKCHEHNDFISLFCVKDKQILCANCVFNNNEKHRGHTILPIKAASDIILRENEKFKKIAKEKFNKLEESIKCCKNNISIIEENFLIVNLELEKEFEELKILIENRKKNTYDYLNKIFNTRIQEYNNKINDLSYLKNCLQDYRYYEIDEKWDQNTFIYIYNINSMIKQTLSNIDLHFKILNKRDLESVNFENKIKIKKEIEKFGEILLKKNNFEDNKIEDIDNSFEKNKVDEESFYFKNEILKFDKKSETERTIDLKDRSMLNNRFHKKGISDLNIKPNDFLIQNEILTHFKQNIHRKDKNSSRNNIKEIF